MTVSAALGEEASTSNLRDSLITEKGCQYREEEEEKRLKNICTTVKTASYITCESIKQFILYLKAISQYVARGLKSFIAFDFIIILLLIIYSNEVVSKTNNYTQGY